MTTCTLGDCVDISMVASLKEELSALLDQEAIVIDASAVERIDAGGLQLLAAFVQEVQVRQGALHWQAPSDLFRQGAKLLGLSQALELEE